LRESFSGILAWADEVGFGSDIRGVRDALDPKALMGFAQDLVVAMSGFLSNTAFVLLTVAFILAEATSFPRKLRVATHGNDQLMHEYSAIVGDIQSYLAIKTKVSLATGLLAMVLCMIVGVDYPLLWGLVALL